MASRRVAIATGDVEHLSVRADLVPICNQFGTNWNFYEVRRPGFLPLCARCAGMLRRLTALADAKWSA